MNINTHNTVYIAYAPYGMQTQHTQTVVQHNNETNPLNIYSPSNYIARSN